MPIIGAMLLSLTGAIIAFFSVLTALDGGRISWPGASSDSRVAAFALPGLATAHPDSLTALRPVPVKIALPAEPAVARPSLGSVAAAASAAGAPTTKAAWVAPVARRVPREPVAEPAVEIPATPSVAAVLPAAASGATATRTAETVRKPQPVARLRSLDTTERSALGGPRQPVAEVAQDVPPLPRRKPRATAPVAAKP